jgi:predicted transcriptional regulator
MFMAVRIEVEPKAYAVVCYIDGKRTGVARYTDDREKAERIAAILNDGADSNPKASGRVVYKVEEVW